MQICVHDGVGSSHSPSELGGPGSGRWEVFLEEGNLEGYISFECF